MRQKIALIQGLHSKALTDDVIDTMLFTNEVKYMSQYCQLHIAVNPTRSGDIHVYRVEDIDSEKAFIFQEMEHDPWQDLAAMCTEAAFLKKQGVKHVTVITPIWRLGHHDDGIPYLCDRVGTQKLVADILEGSAIDRLVTLTPTADMLTDMYPIRVVQPDISKELKEYLRLSGEYSPIVLAVEENVLQIAEDLAYKLGYDFGLFQIRKYECYASVDVCGRDILLYTQRLTDRFDKATHALRRQGCGFINCYLPWIDHPEHLKDDTGIDWLITLETGHGTTAVPMNIEKILAEWIFNDRKSSGYYFD